MENSSKARKITPNYVDNYVDGVDRTVYMHQSGENIYTTARMLFPDHTAWRNRVRCKTERHDSNRIRTVETATVTRFTHPPRNKLIRAVPVQSEHVIIKRTPDCLAFFGSSFAYFTVSDDFSGAAGSSLISGCGTSYSGRG